MTTNTVSAPLVSAIELAWEEIRDRHQDVPEVVVTIGSGSEAQGMRLGHFAANRWERGEDTVHELFVGGEGLRAGATEVFATLLHEAAHAAAQERGVQDTSRQGRYHNKRFKEIAEEFGLDVQHSSKIGWSDTAIPTHVAVDYSPTIARLAAAITAYRRAETRAATGGRTSNNNGAAAECSCGRKIRASLTVLESGPIICGLCGDEFAPAQNV